jgi:hypothetical protein
MTNHKIQLVIQHAISINASGKYDLFENLKTKFWLTNGGRHYPSKSRESFVYIFDDFILVVRKQQLLFFTWFQKFIISNKAIRMEPGIAMDSYTPAKFTYWTELRKEIQINLADTKAKHISAVFTLMALSNETVEKIKSFEERIAINTLPNTR